ncbi:MAG TPA: hypothetical protein VD791_08300, partial [Burkholderiales bacterium]|nr:hypothetical protein [Burkholderiales bacterium]
ADAENPALPRDPTPEELAARASGIRLSVLNATGDQGIREFRVIAGVPARGIADEFERRTGKTVVNWQPHTLKIGNDMEPGRFTLAFRSPAGWTAVRSRRSDAALAEALPAALKQESAAGGSIAAGTLYLVGEDIAQLPPFAIPGWQVARLSEEAPPPSVSPTLVRAVGAG